MDRQVIEFNERVTRLDHFSRKNAFLSLFGRIYIKIHFPFKSPIKISSGRVASKSGKSGKLSQGKSGKKD